MEWYIWPLPLYNTSSNSPVLMDHHHCSKKAQEKVCLGAGQKMVSTFHELYYFDNSFIVLKFLVTVFSFLSCFLCMFVGVGGNFCFFSYPFLLFSLFTSQIMKKRKKKELSWIHLKSTSGLLKKNKNVFKPMPYTLQILKRRWPHLFSFQDTFWYCTGGNVYNLYLLH